EKRGVRKRDLDPRDDRARVADVAVERLGADGDRERLQIRCAGDADVEDRVGTVAGERHRRPDPGLRGPDSAAEAVTGTGRRELDLGRRDDENHEAGSVAGNAADARALNRSPSGLTGARRTS